MGKRRSTPKRQGQGQGQGPRPRSNKGRGAGEPAQIALCVRAKSSCCCSDGRPECLLLVNYCRKQGKSKDKVGTEDRRPQSHGEIPGAEPRQCGGKHLFTCSHVALEPDQKPPRGNGRAGLTATLPTASREVRSSKYQVPAMPKMDAANQMSE